MDAKVRSQIAVCAACIFNRDKQLLLVRKQGTKYFMLPGGKPEANENGEAALLRELHEELRISLVSGHADYLGKWVAPAANEADCDVHATVWEVHILEEVQAAAEIEEIFWYDIADRPAIALAPLVVQCILPFLMSRKVTSH